MLADGGPAGPAPRKPVRHCRCACSLCQHFLEAQNCCSLYYYYPCDSCYLLLTLLCVPGSAQMESHSPTVYGPAVR
uniref:Uncharacterized protein n=1 Tax=Anopheles dirus TaxID=7168 RepID=A0A182N5F1_9DIPT